MSSPGCVGEGFSGRGSKADTDRESLSWRALKLTGAMMLVCESMVDLFAYEVV
jgi:hypothetical protein